MPLELRFDAPLRGKTAIPGDERLTLSLMAFAMRPDMALTIGNPSPAPTVMVLRDFLVTHGARLDESSGGFTMIGNEWPGDTAIGPDVPDEALHILLPHAMRSGAVRVTGSVSRRRLMERLMTVLAPFGMEPGMLDEDRGDIIAKRARFADLRGTVAARSAWELEAVAAASAGLPGAVTVSCPAPSVPHSMKMITHAGGRREAVQDNREIRLNRRLARATGEAPPEVMRLSWPPSAPSRVDVPGDTVIAAAVTAAALMLPKSRVTVEHVLWEQGRRGFWNAARRMKGRIETRSSAGCHFDAADIAVHHGELTGVHLSAAQALTMRPELLLLGALAAAARGESVINDAIDAPVTGRERFMMLARGLERLGCRVGNYTDGLVLQGGLPLRGAHLESGGDSAVALALSVAALNAAGTTLIDDIDKDAWPVGVFRDVLERCRGEFRI